MLAKKVLVTLAVVSFGWSSVDSALAEGGTIKGVAKWEGALPKPPGPIPTGADPHCQKLHEKEPLLSEKLIVNKNNTLKNVFLYVKSGLPAGKKWDVPKEPVVLDQVGCHYVPHIFGIMVGQGLLIRNSDDTNHNIHAMPKNNDEFNKSQSQKGMEFTQTFKNSEIMLPFKCDVHPWMSAYCAVLEHPFFAVTDENGAFEIKGLPDGTYVLATWQEEKRLKPQEQTVTITGGAVQNVEFTFSKGRKGAESEEGGEE